MEYAVGLRSRQQCATNKGQGHKYWQVKARIHLGRGIHFLLVEGFETKVFFVMPVTSGNVGRFLFTAYWMEGWFRGRRQLWLLLSLKPNRQLCRPGGRAPSAGWRGHFILLGTTGL
jgi:hypothetical protein